MSLTEFSSGMQILEDEFGPKFNSGNARQDVKDSERFMRRWHDELVQCGWTVREWLEAARRCTRELRFWPKLSDVMERRPGRLSPTAEAEAAWLAIQDRIASGPYGWSPEEGRIPADDGLPECATAAARSVGGLKAIMSCEIGRQTAMMKREFVGAYVAIVERRTAAESAAAAGLFVVAVPGMGRSTLPAPPVPAIPAPARPALPAPKERTGGSGGGT